MTLSFMRRALACALICAAPVVLAQELSLPFTGRWFVAQGGDTPNVNHHMALKPQWFGVDFAKLGGASQRELSTPNPTQLEHFYSWGAPVLAPVEGEVVSVVNDLPDNALGRKDTQRPAGNHVVIKAGASRFVFLAHFQRGSITVKPGEQVRRGQPLGKCGNSGNTDFPHVHLHVQDQPTLSTGTGVNPVFSQMDVELNGKSFEGVTWPVLRGLFVTAR